MKAEAKCADAELARLQAFILDPMGSLIKLLQGLDNPHLRIEDAREAATGAVHLLGNASSQICCCHKK